MRRIVLGLIMLAAAACTSPAPAAKEPATSRVVDVAGEQSPEPSVAAPVFTIAPPMVEVGPASGDEITGPGTFERSLTIDGVVRRYVLHIPADAWAMPRVPLVVDLHGLGSSPEAQDELTGFTAKADEAGFVVAQPAAGGELPTWQAGGASPVDVVFVRALVEDVRAHVAAGPVFAAGFSNGAGMAHRLACDAPDLVAAIGVVAGAYPDAGPCPTPVPVVAFHGTADPVVPFPGAGSFLPAIEDWAVSWADLAGCTGSRRDALTDDVTATTWEGCATGVVLYVVDGGRHGWPGTASVSRIINSTDSISATDVIWRFFMDVDGG